MKTLYCECGGQLYVVQTFSCTLRKANIPTHDDQYVELDMTDDMNMFLRCEDNPDHQYDLWRLAPDILAKRIILGTDVEWKGRKRSCPT